MIQAALLAAVAVLAILFPPVYTYSMGLTYVEARIKPVSNGGGARPVRFLVDTGATDSLVPASQLRDMGVAPVGQKRYELADGSLQEYAFGFAAFEIMDVQPVGSVIFGPEGSEPLLGVTILESAGIMVDPANLTLKKLPAVPLK